MADADKRASPRNPERLFPLAAFNGERPPAPDWFHAAVATPHVDGVVDVQGAPIRWRRWGEASAPPGGKRGLLFIHGGLAHLGWWDFIAPFFLDDFTPAAFSLSGMGGSGWRERYRMPIYADEALAAAEATGLFEHPEPPLIVGHSFGGFVTLFTAAAHGGRFGGAVVADSPVRRGGPDGPRAEPRRRGGRVYADEASAIARFSLMPTQENANLFLLDHIARGALKSATDDEGRAGFAWVHDPELWIKREVTADGPAEALDTAACPVAFMRGAGSALVDDERWAEMAALMRPGAPRITLPEARHHLMLDEPLAFVSALRALFAAWPPR